MADTTYSGRGTVRAYWELTRLHKFPAGSELYFWPCAWGVTLGALQVNMPLVDLIVQLLAWALGATLFHSAACVWNDMCDYDLDRQVERCKNRPIACGQISHSSAAVFAISLSIPWMLLLSFIHPSAVFVAIVPGIIPLNILYPFMKRWTNWPQVALGFSVNCGFLPAWASVTHRLDLGLLFPMVVGLPAWALVYDTIYACPDRKDDKKAGVMSAAVLLGDYVKPALAGFAGIVVSAVVWTGFNFRLGWPYWLITVGFTAAHFTWQVVTVDLDDPRDCWAKFQSNGSIGFMIWLGLFACYYQGQGLTV